MSDQMNPIDDALDALNTDALDEILCGDIHPIVVRILEDAADEDAPFTLMPDIQKQISHCVTTEMTKVVLAAAMDDDLSMPTLMSIIMSAVRVGFMTLEQYHEQHPS